MLRTSSEKSADAAATGEQPERPDLFISYSRKDAPFVAAFSDALRVRGQSVWIDLEDIRKGADWRAKIEAGIESARVVVAVLSPDFARSKVCADEIEYAVELNKRLVPVLHRELSGAAVHDELSNKQWIRFTEGAAFDVAADEVVETAETDEAWLDEHARFLVRAGEWERAGRNPSKLVRGTDLRDAEQWLAAQGSHREKATPLQGVYIAASRAAARRRQQIMLGLVLLALAVTISLLIYALFQRRSAIREANVALARQLAAESELIRTERGNAVPLSTLLAVEAMRRNPSVEADQALRSALELLPQRLLRLPHGGGAGVALDPATGAVAYGAGRRAVVHPRVGSTPAAAVRRELDIVAIAVAPGARRLLSLAARPREGGRAVFHDLDRGLAVSVPHTDVNIVAFSPDGKVFATADVNGLVQLWDGLTGEPRGSTRGDFSNGRIGIDLIALSARALAVANGPFVRVVNLRTGASRNLAYRRDEFSAARVEDLAWSPNGRYLLAGGNDDSVLWDMSGTRPPIRLAGGLVRAVAFSSRARLVATGDEEELRLWSVTDGELVRTFIAPHARSIAFNPSGSLVATADRDRFVRVWDIATGRERARPPTRSLTVAFTAAGALLTSSREAVELWRIHGSELFAAPYEAENPYGRAASLQFTPNGFLIGGHSEASPRVWDARSGRVVHRSGPSGTSFEVAPDGSVIVAWDESLLSSSPSSLMLSRVGDRAAQPRRLSGLDPATAAFIWNRNLIAAVTKPERRVRFWSLGPIAEPPPPLPVSDLASTLEASRSGRFLAVGTFTAGKVGAARPKAARVFDLNGPRELGHVDHPGIVRTLAFDAEAELVASGDAAGTLVVWSREGRERARIAAGAPVDRVLISPDGRHVATESVWTEGQVTESRYAIWDVESGRRVPGLPTKAYDIVFSPGGRYVATRSAVDYGEGVVRAWWTLWDLRERLPLSALPQASELVFGPNDRFVLFGVDRTAEVWDLARGVAVARLRHGERVRSVAFSADGRLLATATADGTVAVSRWHTEDLVAQACRRLVRSELTAAEWQRYLGSKSHRRTCE